MWRVACAWVLKYSDWIAAFFFFFFYWFLKGICVCVLILSCPVSTHQLVRVSVTVQAIGKHCYTQGSVLYCSVFTPTSHIFVVVFLFYSHRGPQNRSTCVSISSQPNVPLLSFSPMFLNYIDYNIGVMHHFRKAAGRWMLQGGTWGMPA